MNTTISVIDIFAGPGGLGEGFSSVKLEDGKRIFEIKLSIEKDMYAHKTLELRAFFRQFIDETIPVDYYDYLRGKINRKELFKKFKDEALRAKSEAWLAELGKTPNEEVDSRIKDSLNGTQNWVLIGGPPCQAYSLVGRSRMIGEDRAKYETDPRHLLYKEYLRILAVYQPPVFVMENVKGLLSAKIKNQNTFDLILEDLQNPLKAIKLENDESLTYKLFSFSKKNTNELKELEPKDFVVQSENYGIPQTRHRVFIFGIRSDLLHSELKTLSEKESVSIDEVIGDLPKLRSGISKEKDSLEKWKEIIKSITDSKWLRNLENPLKESILREINEFNTNGANLSRGDSYIPATVKPQKFKDWFFDEMLAGVCNHETRIHIREDLHRYFFSSAFAREYGRTPKLRDFPLELLPNHDNVYEALNGSKFNDRFRVQVRGKPSTTIVSHIRKDGHYYIHYDPLQCRSLTVREAARLQTFPDNYFFEGSRTQQYNQVGNAVPPLLAYQIAQIVADVLEEIIK